MRFVILWSVLIFCIGISRAEQFSFETINTLSGLSQNDVISIFQDSDGFMWFGTNDGLNRFDGKNFKVYRKGELASGIIDEIVEDNNKNLWVSTNDNGINRIDLKNGEVEFFTELKSGLLSDNVNSIVIDNNGIVWYSTDIGIGKIILNQGKWEVQNLELTSEISKIFDRSKLFVDSNNNIWILGINVLAKWNGVQLKTVIENKNMNFRFMCKFKDDFIICTQLSAFVFSESNVDAINLIPSKIITNGNINTAYVNENDECYLGSDQSVNKYRYDNVLDSFIIDEGFNDYKNKIDFKRITVRSICQDKSGIMFFGTSGDGVKVYNPNSKKFNHFLVNSGKVKGKIRAVFEDSRQNLYIGYEGVGLYKTNISKEENRFNSFVEINSPFNESSMRNNSVYALTEIEWGTGKKTVIGGANIPLGLIYISGDPIELPVIRAMVFTIRQGENGLVWIGTYNKGLFRFDPSGELPLKQFTFNENGKKGILSEIVRSLCFDSNDRLWIGTGKGLNMLIPSEQRRENPLFESFVYDENNQESLSHNYILPIFESSNNELWVGTLGAGLNRLIAIDKPGKARFQRFTTKDGLPNNVIKAIEEDALGNLWISTNRGISRLDLSTNTFENYDVYEGMQDYEFSELASFKLHTGELLFGGGNGFNVFVPEDIIKDLSVAYPAFTQLNILNESIEPRKSFLGRVVLGNDINHTNTINLKYKENSFSIEVASLHYAFPVKNSCRYKLDGFDKDWVYSKSGNSAKYTNLKPGEYNFRLQAANSNGVWSDIEKSLLVIVNYPFYLTWPMKVAYAVFVILILLFFKEFSIIKVKRMHQLLIQEIEKEKNEEINQMRLKFFTNVSHEFKTPLTLIIGPLEQLMNSEVLPPEKSIRSSISLMYRNAKVLLRLINQLMDFRKMERGQLKLKVKEGDIKEFASEIHESFMPIAIKKDIQFNLVSHIIQSSLYFDYDKLSRVLTNLLSNAFKFTDEGGVITLELLEDESDRIIIIVSDNGCGIPQSAQDSIFERFFQQAEDKSGFQKGSGIGLAYTKSLVELMHGEIYFKSKEGEGTMFFVKLPYNKDAFNPDEFQDENIEVNYHLDKISMDELQFEVIEQESASYENEAGLSCILLVEDNDDFRIFLQDYFSKNYNVITAADGVEGIQKALEYNPDLIITDVAMPKMDGVKMTEKLKNQQETSHIPIVMLTAQSNEQSFSVGLNSGADVYIPKPVKVKILDSQVKSLLLNRQLLRAKFREKLTVRPSDLSPSHKDEVFLKKVINLVEDNMGNGEFSVQMLSAELGLSQTTLNSKLNSLTGQKAKIFIRTLRLKRASQLLIQGDLSISEITYNVGFNDLQYFRKCFVSEFGCLPSEYAKGIIKIDEN